MQYSLVPLALHASALGVLAVICGRAAEAQDKRWQVLPFAGGSSQGTATLLGQADGSILVGGPNPDVDVHRLNFDIDMGTVTGLRIEALPHSSMPKNGPGRSANGNFVLSEARFLHHPSAGESARDIAIATVTAGYEQERHPAQSSCDGLPNTGWAISPHSGKPHEIVFEFLRDLPTRKGTRIELELSYLYGGQHSIGCYRVSATTEPRPIRAPEAQHGEEWGVIQEKINRAIDRGVEYLLRQQELDGSWRYHSNEFVNGQTALAAYTLLKSGVKPEHQAVQRALAYLRNRPCIKTYELGCAIMAFVATKDAKYNDLIQEFADELASWQQKEGGYGYPENRVDLSNTQYAALGLRAAARTGAKVDPETWRLLIQRSLKHHAVPSGAYDPSGFGYVDVNGPTGSMTCAGVSILKIAFEELNSVSIQDRRDGDLRGAANAAIRRGVDWLGRHFSVTTNPPDNKEWNWYRYYLYGLERVGALINEREIGGHDWYREGARQLVRNQRGDGAWDNGDSGQPETCYALLFLVKATSPATGSTAPLGVPTYGSDDPKAAVSLRASGDTPLTLWISSYGDQTKKTLTWPGDPEGELRIASVEYVQPNTELLIDGEGFALPWRHTSKAPVPAQLAGPWLEPQYDDGKWTEGPVRYPSDAAGRERELFLRRTFTVEAAGIIEPRLLLLAEEGTAVIETSDLPPTLALWDEGAPLELPHRREETTQEVVRGGAPGSAHALRVAGPVIENSAIVGWNYAIKRSPGKGEFRYLRFAWKKSGGKGIMLQIAIDGRWENAMRYYSGENSIGFEPALQVDKKLPTDWVVVTRDLFRDLGREGTVTGIAFTPMDGEAGLFDQIYLGRSSSDVQKLPAASSVEAESLGQIEVWLNGISVHRGPARTNGYIDISHHDALLAAIKSGANVLCARVQRPDGAPQVCDLRLVHDKRLAIMPGEPKRSAGRHRFPYQHRFTTPGDRVIAARVQVAVPSLEEGREFDLETIESPSLRAEIREPLDPILLEYASDPSRNLLPAMAPGVEASSHLGGWEPNLAIDNRQSRGWLCADGDASPWISIATAQPLRCNTILLSHPRLEFHDGERTARARIVEIEINGKGPNLTVLMPGNDLRKAVLALPKVVSLRQLRVRVLERRDVAGKKSAVGFGEVEVQLRRN